MLKEIKIWWQNINHQCCHYCNNKAVVECTTHNEKKIYLCSNCLRACRFREKDFFKSILPYGSD